MFRELIIMKRAENAIYKVAAFKAEKNFPASGERFIDEVLDFCFELSKLNINIAVLYISAGGLLLSNTTRKNLESVVLFMVAD